MFLKKKNTLSILIYLIPFSLVLGILIAEILTILICIVFIYKCIKENDLAYFKSNFFKIFIFCYIFFLINSFLSKDIYLSLKVSLPYIRYGLLSLAICYCFEKNENFLKEFKYFLIPIIFVLLFDGYFQYFFGNNIFGYSTQSSRLSGLFFDEWILGSFLQKFYPLLCLVLFFGFTNTKYFNLKSIFLILTYILIFLSGERAAFFLLNFYLILILFMGFSVIKRVKKLFYFSLPLIFFIVILSPMKNRIFLISSDMNFKNSIINFYNYNYEAFFKTSVNIFLDNKIYGSGIKTFRVLCKDYYYIDPIKSCSTHPHNYYFQILAETGFIGFTIISIILFYFCISYILYLFKDRLYLYQNFEKLIILSGLIMLIWPFTTSGSFFNNFLSIIFFFNLGFLIRNINSKNP